MKTSLFKITSCIVCAMLSLSCGFSDKNTGDEILNDTISQPVEQNSGKELSEVENEKNLIKAILKDKQPLNQQELLDIFPFRIQEHSSENVKVIPGVAMVTGSFGESIKLTLQDYAGTNANAIFDFLESYENEKKSISPVYKERENIITKNLYQNENGEISFVHLNRFIITLEGKKMTPDQLWEIFDVGILSSLEVLNQFNNRNH